MVASAFITVEVLEEMCEFPQSPEEIVVQAPERRDYPSLCILFLQEWAMHKLNDAPTHTGDGTSSLITPLMPELIWEETSSQTYPEKALYQLSAVV